MFSVVHGNRRGAAMAGSALMAAVLFAGCAASGGPPATLRRQAPSSANASWNEIVRLRRVLSANPDDTQSRLALADLLTDTGDHRGAERNYRQVLEREPDNRRAINNLADLYSRTGSHLEWAAEKMKPVAEEESVHRHVFLDTLGSVYLRMRRWGDARDAFRTAATLCRRGSVAASREECRLIEEHLAQAEARSGTREAPVPP